MINISKNDIVIVKFPFASSIKYKVRPAVIVSSNLYNNNERETVIILAISSNIKDKLNFEIEVENWQKSGLLKPSIFKSAIATIEKSFIIQKIGRLSNQDINNLDNLLLLMLKKD